MVTWAVLGKWWDLAVLEGFFNLNDSEILPKHLCLTPPVEFTVTSVNNHIIFMTFFVVELLVLVLLSQGDVPGTYSSPGPPPRQCLPPP